ncbi:zinc ribbon domain-containing protein [Paraliomyxa miuraensis]|uniref:zinc ribbon domain-containing protein n=1 Tax=Paraliomyxa miuraensis TaxID=376150 RepID=UPI00224EE067|nr:zinc ribbon domain-containing protein [Paraliomyxa miuraensis]MCX4243051.1 zinc ribbon domain-containing protein [Paraliomyxa miuraensis]
MHERELGTFEMLWDCSACGTPKLLGIQHRHCPACGSPQDPSARYYPSDEDKIAVQNHVYQGADLICPACTTANAGTAQFCVGCGSPLGSDAKQAAARTEQQAAHGQGFSGESVKDARAEARARRDAQAQQARAKPAAPGMSRGLKIGLIVGGGVLLLGIIVFVLFFWKREAAVEVEGHRWARTIDIEVFDDVRDSEWCDQMPRKARNVSRRKEQRSTKKVQDGEECVKKRKDNRDGTFKEVQECKPKYREEPVYDQKCYFEIEKWAVRRTEKAEGQSKDPEPAWPAVTLSKPGTCKGCEREGKRVETYWLRLLRKEEGQADECEVERARWDGAEVGSRFMVKVGVVGDGIDCDSLQPAP